jgi:hypothetical protein
MPPRTVSAGDYDVLGSGLRFEERGRRELRGLPGECGLCEVVG